jgi:hypothetical protein
VPDLAPDEVIRQDPRWWQAVQGLRQKYPPPQPTDLSWADALVLGSPSYFGNMAAALKHWLEQTVLPWRRENLEEHWLATPANPAPAGLPTRPEAPAAPPPAPPDRT